MQTFRAVGQAPRVEQQTLAIWKHVGNEPLGSTTLGDAAGCQRREADAQIRPGACRSTRRSRRTKSTRSCRREREVRARGGPADSRRTRNRLNNRTVSVPKLSVTHAHYKMIPIYEGLRSYQIADVLQAYRPAQAFYYEPQGFRQDAYSNAVPFSVGSSNSGNTLKHVIIGPLTPLSITWERELRGGRVRSAFRGRRRASATSCRFSNARTKSVGCATCS